MANYFDATDQTHRALLPPAYRGHSELATVATLVEADVIGYYTMTPPYQLYTAWLSFLLGDRSDQIGSGGILFGIAAERGTGKDITATGQPEGADVAPLRVYLRGYEVNASDAKVDPNLKIALRHTIAEVIAWRLNQWTAVEPGVKATAGTDAGVPKSKGFRPTAEDAFPPDWNRRLERFDSRPVSWSL